MTTPQPLIEEVRATLPDELRHSVRLASELARGRRLQLREQPLSTAVPALDQLLGGGLPPGTLVELIGKSSSGRFAILLAAIRAVTDTGQPAALVDQGEQLDPRSAEQSGIDLARLLWLRPRLLPDTLAAAEILVHTGFPLIALDLGLPPVRGRAPLAAWLRLARGAACHQTVVLLGSPYPSSGCAAFAVLSTSRVRGRWSGVVGDHRLLDGLESRLEVIRQRGRRPHAAAALILNRPEANFESSPHSEPIEEEMSHVQAL